MRRRSRLLAVVAMGCSPAPALASDPSGLVELALGALALVVMAVALAWFLLKRATGTLAIRAEAPDDADAIEAVTLAAFRRAEHSNGREQAIVRDLRRAGALSVARPPDQGGAVLGHVAVSPVQLSGGEPGWFGLGPVSVHPHFQRKGLGSRLVNRALEELRARGASGCVVLGDPGYYGRFGFAPSPDLVLPGVPAGYFQALAFIGDAPRGEATFHEAFGPAPVQPPSEATQTVAPLNGPQDTR